MCHYRYGPVSLCLIENEGEDEEYITEESYQPKPQKKKSRRDMTPEGVRCALRACVRRSAFLNTGDAKPRQETSL